MSTNYYLIGVKQNSSMERFIDENILYAQNEGNEDIVSIDYQADIPDGTIPKVGWLRIDTEDDQEIKKIEVESITYGRVAADNNYGNHRLTITAKPGENVSETLEILQRYVAAKTKTEKHFIKLRNDIHQKEQELKKLVQAIAEAKYQWEATSEFLKAQGIKQDCSPFPSFNNKVLPQSVDGEIVEEESEF